MTCDYQYLVIGAGVVGLAVAAELASRGPLLIVEKDWKFGQSTSSHNSEVVHAGIYYPPGSLKAQLCVAGNRCIRELSAQFGFGYRPVGKYIVATTETETEYLHWLKDNAAQNGVTDLRWISLDELRDQEPSVQVVSCLFSPTSGIVDSHGLMACFKTQAELVGADFAFNSEVIGICSSPCLRGDQRGAGYKLTIRDTDGSETSITTERVINCAGLYSDRMAELAGLDIRGLELELHWTKGYYYTVEGGSRLNIRHLVYPVPDHNMKSLGVHATVDLAGGVRFGPTAFYLEHKTEDYSFSNDHLDQVASSIRRYLPAFSAVGMNAIMAGIRPKLSGPGQPARDFYINEESAHGLPGFVNLIGIESPGLTAAPAIAEYVRRLL